MTAKVLRKVGYKKFSRYINLSYGEERNEWEQVVNFNDEKPDIHGN